MRSRKSVLFAILLLLPIASPAQSLAQAAPKNLSEIEFMVTKENAKLLLARERLPVA